MVVLYFKSLLLHYIYLWEWDTSLHIYTCKQYNDTIWSISFLPLQSSFYDTGQLTHRNWEWQCGHLWKGNISSLSLLLDLVSGFTCNLNGASSTGILKYVSANEHPEVGCVPHLGYFLKLSGTLLCRQGQRIFCTYPWVGIGLHSSKETQLWGWIGKTQLMPSKAEGAWVRHPWLKACCGNWHMDLINLGFCCYYKLHDQWTLVLMEVFQIVDNWRISCIHLGVTLVQAQWTSPRQMLSFTNKSWSARMSMFHRAISFNKGAMNPDRIHRSISDMWGFFGGSPIN